jgi:hypothetical protein
MNQPIAWAYEATEYADKTYEGGWKRYVSFEKPFDETGGLRNVIPLYAAPGVPNSPVT